MMPAKGLVNSKRVEVSGVSAMVEVETDLLSWWSRGSVPGNFKKPVSAWNWGIRFAGLMGIGMTQRVC